jgi:two-component sensor histidine kinase
MRFSAQQLRRLVRPNSLGAYAFAGVCIVAGTALRATISWVDPGAAPYTIYFPIILIIALLCGAAVALVALVVVIIVGWWAFIPPHFEFAALTPRSLLNISLFALASIITIWLADAYRRAVEALQVEKRERELLVDELAHRGKNTFAVVSFIIMSSLDDYRERANEIVERVRAVSSTNDLITNSRAQTVELKQILDQEFAPYGASRVTMNGEPIELSANAGRGFALIAHELVTNSVKHGALSSSNGAIDIAWSSDGAQVRLRWVERGGPEVSGVSEAGFGSWLVVRTLRQLKGEIATRFPPEGLVCELTFSPK